MAEWSWRAAPHSIPVGAEMGITLLPREFETQSPTSWEDSHPMPKFQATWGTVGHPRENPDQDQCNCTK